MIQLLQRAVTLLCGQYKDECDYQESRKAKERHPQNEAFQRKIWEKLM